MVEGIETIERRTTADAVFDRLSEEILSLKLLPGARLSELDVAERFGVSRQPVRDAFTRLGNLNLLLIRPQKTTLVRGFSAEAIEHARFVRLAVELEVLRRACDIWDDKRAEDVEVALHRQERAVAADDTEAFHALDSTFHALICERAGLPRAAETIHDCKRQIDRLCRLSFGREHEAQTLLDDHRNLAEALCAHDAERATAVVRTHLSRLDDTIAEISEDHAEFFE